MPKAPIIPLEKEFSKKMLKWNKTRNNREMPWKGEKDAYKIWLSEIILQQTRVEQGLGYFNRFVNTYPTILQLANAPDAAVFKLWEGLGYYSRCRNLLATARLIATEKKGVFPATYEEILSLKGIGPYTAAAISSFAFNLPHAVVDGNVFRVLARVFGIATPIDSTEGKKYFTTLANELLDKKQAGIYNQAIMDFGAVVCKPALPLCPDCIFNKTCYAYLNNKVNSLPVKEKKISIKKRMFYYLVMDYKGKTAIRQRVAKDVWQQLYEFPQVEAAPGEALQTVLQAAEEKEWIKKGQYAVVSVSAIYRQQLSHQLISAQFITLQVQKKPVKDKELVWVSPGEIKAYAFPGLINQYLSGAVQQTLL